MTTTVRWLAFFAQLGFALGMLVCILRSGRRRYPADVDMEMALDSAAHYYEPPGRKTP